MSNIVWIGPRKSDIQYTGDFFKGSITLYGDNKDNNFAFCVTKDYRINHNNITSEQTVFMNSQEMVALEHDADTVFMSYNPALMDECNQRVQNNTLCYNAQSVLEFFNSKKNFRNLAMNCVPTLHSEYVKGNKCNIEYFQTIFPEYSSFIVQKEVASGGYGTYIIESDNEQKVSENLNPDEIYLVSPYYKNNIPINIHAIIYAEDIIIFPGSVQVMLRDNDRLLYRGADYVTYNNLADSLKATFRANTMEVCKKIQETGYRGILGIDAMIVDDAILMLEVNNRFQASTLALNCALSEQGLKSVHEMNYESFTQKKPSIKNEVLENINVGYSCFVYINESNSCYKRHINYILKNAEKSPRVKDIFLDGYNLTYSSVEDEAYLFKVIFNTNITSISMDKTVRIHPNIVAPSEKWFYGITENKDFIKLKISLINQGVVLSDNAKEYINQNGGMRPGVYCAVDITIDDRYIVNAPLYVKFSEMSPFLIDYVNDGLKLYYYGIELYSVTVNFESKIAKMVTSSGIPIKRICFLATDRLRIQNSPFCTFKEHHVPCKFCEAQYMQKSFSVKDILEAVEIYFNADKPPFRHILIGGLSNDIGKEKNCILEICNYIRKKTDMPIYLMCLPPHDLSDIDDYISAGVTEFGFNIELFDREAAKHFMPGKGMIPVEQYYSALKYATEIIGKNGEVRSALVVGLENKDTLMDGIEKLCRLGVAPILSILRPIPGTEMENVIVPENEWLYDVYIEAQRICHKYNLELGPNCAYCQNNTLSLKMIE